MGYIDLPPPVEQFAEARETIVAALDPVSRAELETISRNIKLSGTEPQQEAFKTDVAAIDAIMGRAIAMKSPAEVAKAKTEATAAIKQRILDNRAYAPFKVFVAKDVDPLLPR